MPGGGSEGESGQSGQSSAVQSSSVPSSVASGASVMLSLDVGSLNEMSFDPKGYPHGICQRWKKGKRSFKLYLTGKGETDDAQKRAILLHAAGVDVQEIYVGE